MAVQKSGEGMGTSNDTSQSVQDTARQSFFGNIMQRIRNLRSGQQGRVSTPRERSLSSRSSCTEDVKQSIEGENSHGEECGYYRLYQEAKTEGKGQHKRADKYERAWKLSEDSVRQLQEENKQKDLWVRDVEYRNLQKEENIQELSGSIRREKAIVKERDNEIIVLQKRIQDLHEDLDEEMTRKSVTEIQNDDGYAEILPGG